MTEPSIRESVDPNSTLPKVKLVAKPGSTEHSDLQLLTINHNGKFIGQTILMRVRRADGIVESCFRDPVITEGNKGKGFGTAAYLAGIELAQANGEIFRTDDADQTPDAARVWQRFVEAGIAHVIEPLEPYTMHTPDGQTLAKYKGHIEIPLTGSHA